LVVLYGKNAMQYIGRRLYLCQDNIAYGIGGGLLQKYAITIAYDKW
jgi:hypothetical protein